MFGLLILLTGLFGSDPDDIRPADPQLLPVPKVARRIRIMQKKILQLPMANAFNGCSNIGLRRRIGGTNHPLLFVRICV